MFLKVQLILFILKKQLLIWFKYKIFSFTVTNIIFDNENELFWGLGVQKKIIKWSKHKFRMTIYNTNVFIFRL